MTDVRTADWSAEVAPFWGAVIRSALTADGVLGLLRAGWCGCFFIFGRGGLSVSCCFGCVPFAPFTAAFICPSRRWCFFCVCESRGTQEGPTNTTAAAA